MANLEVNASSSVCRKCGRAYGKLKGYFPVCYAYLYKGTGYIPYCNDCVRGIYTSYYAECGDEEKATRQVCRKLDLYWNHDLYVKATNRTGSRTVLQNYISRLNNAMYAGKSYDDTLREEKRMWDDDDRPKEDDSIWGNAQLRYVIPEMPPIEISEDVIAFWGPGYTPEMYMELEQRLQYYKEQMGEDAQTDMGTEALLRQIAMMEIDINKARANGASVDKMVNSLNSLLSSLKKPTKKDSDIAGSNTPFGVWIKRIEDERPIPDVDEELRDVDHIVKYITVWFFGHLCKMLGIKNSYCRMYEDEIARLRVNKPEYDEEDDDVLLSDMFGGIEFENGGDADGNGQTE